MSLPFGKPDTTFDSFLQELPANYHELAFEFKAFTRSRKIKTPAQLMLVVMSYCGINQVLRETAGSFTLLEERMSDTAIQNRLKACVPWVKAVLTAMIGPVAKALAKVLLYLRLPEAERQPVLERTELAAKLRTFGKLNAKRRERLALAYDRTLIGPRVIVDVPVAVITVEEASGRTVRPHWRRGHFRRLVGEAGRLAWVRPTLVNAAEAFGLERGTPHG